MREGTWSVNIMLHAEADAAATFTNMPAGDTFLFSSHRHVTLIDVSGMNKVRLKVNKQATAGQAGATLALRYSPSFSTAVGNYSDIGVSAVSVAIDVTNQYLDSGWVELNNDVKGMEDIYIAVVGNGGNGTIDPQFGSICVSFA